MPRSKTEESISISIVTMAALVLIVLGCKSLPGAKMNMFEGTNAQDGAAKVKAKLGVENVNVSRME
ncbi:MAG: hypothetical protein ACXW3C_10835, partial [Pyrinomonadaceae bacterium]